MEVTQLTVDRAKKMATDNYDTWGAQVIEAMNDTELVASLERASTLAHWVRIQKLVQSVIDERASAPPKGGRRAGHSG